LEADCLLLLVILRFALRKRVVSTMLLEREWLYRVFEKGGVIADLIKNESIRDSFIFRGG
jgi:hypothetical protein